VIPVDLNYARRTGITDPDYNQLELSERKE